MRGVRRLEHTSYSPQFETFQLSNMCTPLPRPAPHPVHPAGSSTAHSNIRSKHVFDSGTARHATVLGNPNRNYVLM